MISEACFYYLVWFIFFISGLISVSPLLRLEYKCLLTNTTGGYFCSINKLDETPDVKRFTDLDEYEISLCQSRDDGSESCEVLEKDYNPSLNSKECNCVDADCTHW